jgi:hypothetical protein
VWLKGEIQIALFGVTIPAAAIHSGAIVKANMQKLDHLHMTRCTCLIVARTSIR